MENQEKILKEKNVEEQKVMRSNEPVRHDASKDILSDEELDKVSGGTLEILSSEFRLDSEDRDTARKSISDKMNAQIASLNVHGTHLEQLSKK